MKAEGPTSCCDGSPSGGFDYKGKTSFDVQKGDVYGFRMSGSHYTGGPQMSGSIFIREVDDSPPSITPVVEGVQGANGIYTGPVKVSWKLADADSRILETKGCEAVTVSEETAGKAITCAATSRGGKATKTVTVAYDATAPELTVPAAVAVQAPTAAGAVVNYAATAVDKLDPAPAVACTPASGSLLPVGTTSVSCTATDAAGNQTTKAFDALVVAPTPGATVLPAGQARPDGDQRRALVPLRDPQADDQARAAEGQERPEGRHRRSSAAPARAARRRCAARAARSSARAAP